MLIDLQSGNQIANNRPGGLKPAAFGGSYSQEIISDFDIYTPSEQLELFSMHGYEPGFMSMLKAFGSRMSIHTPTYGHYEEDWRTDLLSINAVITPASGAGEPIIVELTADSMIAITGESGATHRGSYPLVGDVVNFPSGRQGRITAKNTATNPHRVTIVPGVEADNINADAVAGASYHLATNAFGEGTGQPSGRVERFLKYNNRTQIIKSAIVVTGSEETNMAYFEPIRGKKGSVYLKGAVNTEYRHTLACDGALLFGRANDNFTQTSDALGYDVKVHTTSGAIEHIEDAGHVDYFQDGNYELDDFAALGRIAESERIPVRVFAAFAGYEWYTQVMGVLVDFLRDTHVDYTAKDVFGDNTGGYSPGAFAVKIGFSAIEYGGYNWIFKKMPMFNDPKGAGAPGYNWNASAMILPLGTIEDKKNPGRRIPTCGYAYKELNGYSRETEVWDTGGSGNIKKTSRDDVRFHDFRSDIGFWGACMYASMLQRPEAT
jgi:hypothetical protein